MHVFSFLTFKIVTHTAYKINMAAYTTYNTATVQYGYLHYLPYNTTAWNTIQLPILLTVQCSYLQ